MGKCIPPPIVTFTDERRRDQVTIRETLSNGRTRTFDMGAQEAANAGYKVPGYESKVSADDDVPGWREGMAYSKGGTGGR